MTAESFDLDEAYRRKKKAVLVIVALLVVLLGGTLLVGLAGGPPGTGTPSPSAVAVITTPPLTTVTLLPATPTGTSSPMPSSTPTPGPTDTARPPSATQTQTPTSSPSPTPPPLTPTPSLSPTPPPPTPTATITPIPRRVPVIETPLDGSELPGLGLIVQGTAEAGATVRVYAGEILVGEALADEAGNWSLVPAEQLAAGEQRIVAVDLATGATSAAVTFTLLQAWLPVSGDEQPCPPQDAKTPPERCP